MANRILSKITDVQTRVNKIAEVRDFTNVGSVLSTTPSNPIYQTSGRNGTAVTYDRYATHAAIQVMQKGGSAFDAAIAAMAMLGLTRPGNCGIGGGGYAVYYNASTDRVETIDFREVSLLKTNPHMFYRNGSLLSITATTPYRQTQMDAVGVPGTVAFWDDLINLGLTKLSLAENLYPTIDLARNGFPIDQTFNDLIAKDNNFKKLRLFTSSSSLYLQDASNGYPVGSTHRNPDYAFTLEEIAYGGCKEFYRGNIARDIVNCVNTPPLVATPEWDISGAPMSLEDLSLYQTRRREPLKTSFRDCSVFGCRPSTSGGLTLAMMLKFYEKLIPNPLTATDASGYHARLLASRYAFADRGVWMADPEFFPVPVNGLLDDSYLNSRVALMPTKYDGTKLTATNGYPTIAYDLSGLNYTILPNQLSSDSTNSSTTGCIFADKYGNVISLTFTIEQIFGTGCVVPGRGFILNNEITDFDTVAVGSKLPANGPEPRKRPRSSITPTLVFKNGKPIVAIATSGGTAIIPTNLNLIIDMIDKGLDPSGALNAGRYFDRNGGNIQLDYKGQVGLNNADSQYTLLTSQMGYPTGYSSSAYFRSGTSTTGPILPISHACALKINQTTNVQTAAFNWAENKGSAENVTPL